MSNYELVLLKNVHDPRTREIDHYIELGGYEAARKVLKEATPADVIETTKATGLRGRGGAGFPTGLKWSFVPKNTGKPTYLCCNADESEPGTCKDRVILERDPHQLIEGMIIASYAVDCHLAFIYIRGEFTLGYRVVEAALEEARAKGISGNGDSSDPISISKSFCTPAPARISAEKKPVCSNRWKVSAGIRGRSRRFRPSTDCTVVRPSSTTSRRSPTCPTSFTRGVDWFKSIGSDEKNTGPKLYCVSGHVNKPAVIERELGVPLPELIYEVCGGVRNGNKLKGVIPGGSSVPILKADEIDVRMDFDSLAKKGTLLGSAGCMVMDETACIVKLAWRTARFYAEETCGQCTQCREGTWWMDQVLHRIEHGHGKMQDLDMILDMCSNMKGVTICVLSDACAMPVEAMIKKFREEFEYHITEKRCMVNAITSPVVAESALR